MVKEKGYFIRVPDDIVSRLDLNTEHELTMTIQDNRLILTKTTAKSDWRQYLGSAIVTLLSSIGLLIYWLINGINEVKLTGSYSIASFVIVMGVLTGSLVFGVTFIKQRRIENTAASKLYWRNFPTIIISFAVILLLVLTGVFWLLGSLFTGASLDCWTATIIFLLFNFISNCCMLLVARSFDSVRLITLFAMVIVSGVVIAMAANGQRHWWQYNLSFLGTNSATSSWQFNFTLIIAAFILIALIDYLFVSLHELYPNNWRLLTLRILLMLLAIDLGAVGLFPNNSNLHILHDRVATYLVYLIIILIIGIRWLLPQVTREFLSISYGIAAALIVMAIAFQVVGYLSLTVFEISTFILAFTWIVMLFRRLQLLTQESFAINTFKISLTQLVTDEDEG
ncbi:DUF998 domain-containing protein [Loigolactobacillus backii]|uniref:AbrB/MazE/SpoVT family DNA-binding domain-containing protein n=1 Tax=Loigolactobacillus backii TaxID=375175 RepID=UPI0022FD666D|nr:DUF998 domain-containing protein [Loigolactobacillus backii]MDA5387796.1 DUF998 domain-containing protein [Loigolactobacillus backii]MDA5390874.1 DUF998 domain-containing protein [Loigolactobacillus backii]